MGYFSSFFTAYFDAGISQSTNIHYIHMMKKRFPGSSRLFESLGNFR